MRRHSQSDIIWNTIRNPQCRECGLHEHAQSVCLLGDGPVPAMGMIIGEAPGNREDNIQIPFSGKSGLFLRKTLKEIGIDPRTVYITNTVSCRPPSNRTPSTKEAKICSSLYLVKQIELVKPRAILCLGNVAVKFALGRKSAVTKMEGTTFTYKSHNHLQQNKQTGLFDGGRNHIAKCIPSRHPSAVIRLEEIDPKSYAFAVQQFKENLLLFRKILLGLDEKDTIEFEKNGHRFLLDLYEDHQMDNRPPYTDIESNGLNPFRNDSKIHCIGFSSQCERLASFPLDRSYDEEMRHLLGTRAIMAHRGTFEGIWLRHKYGITPRIYHDTKVGAHLINENEPTGLKYQCVRYLNVDPWNEEQDFEDPNWDTMLPYNARDARYGERLYRERQLPFLKEHPKIAKLLRYIVLPAEEVLIEMICNGFHIDMNEAKERLKRCQEEKKRLNEKIDAIAGRHINPASPKQMNTLFYEDLGMKCPVPSGNGGNSTAEAALIRLKGQHEIVDITLEWRKWQKYDGTYFTPWIAQGPTPHPNYDNTGTDTGRLSSSMVKNKRGEKKKGAVIHQCPRDKFIRNIVTPRFNYETRYVDVLTNTDGGVIQVPVKNPKWCIVEADLSQIELRLVAHAARERTMIQIFNDDEDIHLATAQDLAEGEIDEETRKRAKAVNFGFVYGMWWRKFVAYCLEKFDLKISDREGKEYRKKFFRKYSGLLSWHRRVEAHVSARGEIANIFGRVRHLPDAIHDSKVDEWIRKEAVRQAINSPIQGAASDLLQFIAALIGSYSLHWDYKVDREQVLFVGTAHDSLLMECTREYAPVLKKGIDYTVGSIGKLIKRYFDVQMLVPIKMDIKAYSDCWKGTPLLLP